MILHQSLVEQTVDRDERDRFIKELVVVRVRSTAAEVAPASRGIEGARAPGGEDPVVDREAVVHDVYSEILEQRLATIKT